MPEANSGSKDSSTCVCWAKLDSAAPSAPAGTFTAWLTVAVPGDWAWAGAGDSAAPAIVASTSAANALTRRPAGAAG
ncbi:hypothetical protein D3C87_2041390 [compost metagenome]